MSDTKNLIRASDSGLTSSVVYSALKQRIVNGELSGGAALKQDELAREFGVSKIPVREALRQLEQDNLVEFRPRRGAVVTSLSADDLAAILDVRIALECRALELAIPNMVEDDFVVAGKILDEYSQEVEAEQWSHLNLRFHRCLYAPSGNGHLLNYIRELQERMGAFLRMKVSMATGLERPHAEHLALLDACRARQVDTAVAILRTHIEHTQREVAAHFRRQLIKHIE